MSAKTLVVNLRAEPFDVYIGRAGKGQDGYFGNPFDVRIYGKIAMPLYEAYFAKRLEVDPEFKRRVLELRGKRLGCFCKPRECHGDVIARWLDAELDDEGESYDCDADEEDEFFLVACRTPGCVMPGSHYASECYTAEQAEEWAKEQDRG